MACIPALHQLCTKVKRSMAEANLGNTLLPAFIAKRKPSISIDQYASKIVEQSECSEACFVYAMVLVERLLERGVRITEMNVHRIILVVLMDSAKLIDDAFYDNSSFAIIGGVSNSELNMLELEFLTLMDFNISVAHDEFQRKYQLCLQ